MDEKEIIIISIIENEFDNLSINNLINKLKRIPQHDFKNTRTFILKLFRDIDTATKNSKVRIKKYFQSLKSQNDQIIKKIYFQSRNKPLIAKYNSKENTNTKDSSMYQKQNVNDIKTYDNIQSIKNLKSSDENSIKDCDDIFTKNMLEMKFFSGNNGMKGNPFKFKKKINLGNKSLSEFKIKTKHKISLNDSNKNSNKENYNLFKLYNKTIYNKNNSNNKFNNTSGNKIEINNYPQNKDNANFLNLKLSKNLNIKKKVPSYDKKKIIKNNPKLISGIKDKEENLISFNNDSNNSIIKDITIKNYRDEKNDKEIKRPINIENGNNSIIEGKRNLSIVNNNENNEDSIQYFANEIINFIDNMKDLQKNIINKNPNIKEMKYNFEKQKYLLYQKAIKLSKITNKDNIINNKIDLNLNINHNNENLKNSSILMDKSTNNTFNNNSSNLDNTKELNLSIVNLRKTIEDIKNNSEFLTGQLKSEITSLNNKIREKNQKENEYEKIIIDNLSSIRKIYKILLTNSIKQYDLLSSLENQSPSPRNSNENKFNWYVNEIIKLLELLINNNKKENENEIIDKNVVDDKKEEIEKINNNMNEMKNGLLKNIMEIINWINPLISKEKDKNNILQQLEINFEQNKFKDVLEIFKSKIKEIIELIENLKKEIKKQQDEIKIKENEIKRQDNEIKKRENEIKRQENEIKKKENEIKEKAKINKIEKNVNKNQINLSNEDDEDNLNDKNNFLQLNATLLGIQNDLIQKIENKQEEIEKTKKDLKNSIQLNKEFMNMAKNQTGQDVNIFSEKYNYLLDLYNSEQDKVKFLQNEYMNLLNGLSNYVNNGEEIIIKLGKMWDLNPILKTNFEMAEPEFPEIEPINESDLFTENS